MAAPTVTPEEAAKELLRRKRARESGPEYRHYVSGLEPAAHSRLLWSKLQGVMEGKIKRLMVFMPPGSAKTLDCSHYFPAYYLSKFPKTSIIGATHTDKFAEQNGRRVRGIIQSDEHRILFPDIQLSEDSTAAARWETTKGGIYMGFGVGATVVGRRSGGLILDDVVAGISAADSQTDRNFVWEWFGADLVTRLTPGGWIILVMTRYHPDDIAGRLLAASNAKFGDKWEVLSLPAIAKENDPLGRKPGAALWPEWQNEKELNRIKNQPSLSNRLWSALYQQEPVIESGNLIKRAWIKIWGEAQAKAMTKTGDTEIKKYKPPPCSFILQSWDTAITNKDKSAFSVCLTFGVFKEPDTEVPSVMLLSRWRGRVDYPNLRKMAQRLAVDYLDDNMEVPSDGRVKYPPDTILIEAKATGEPLIADLARAGISAHRFNPNRHGDKTARLMLVTDIFENGRFWVPGQPPMYTMPRRWADEYVNSMIAFPAAASRDDADATSQALIFLKTHGWVKNTEDPVEPQFTRVGKQLVRGPLYG